MNGKQLPPTTPSLDDPVIINKGAEQQDPAPFESLLQQLDTQVNRYLEGALNKPRPALHSTPGLLPSATQMAARCDTVSGASTPDTGATDPMPTRAQPHTHREGSRWTALPRVATATRAKWALLGVLLSAGFATVCVVGTNKQPTAPLASPLRQPAPEWGLLSGAEAQPAATKAAPAATGDSGRDPIR